MTLPHKVLETRFEIERRRTLWESDTYERMALRFFILTIQSHGVDFRSSGKDTYLNAQNEIPRGIRAVLDKDWQTPFFVDFNRTLSK